jgi:hypothetical protein
MSLQARVFIARTESLSVVVSVRGNGIFAAETRSCRNRFIEIQLAICGEKGSPQGNPAPSGTSREAGHWSMLRASS